MILADTSVWIAFFREVDAKEVALLIACVREGRVLMGDLILVEILQGLRTQAQEHRVATALADLKCVTMCGPDIAPIAAANFRALRRKGITIRGTIDVVIATWCIENGVPLLHNDRDFAAMEKALGLQAWR
jgi:predicted nucleic acid-binding protein